MNQDKQRPITRQQASLPFEQAGSRRVVDRGLQAPLACLFVMLMLGTQAGCIVVSSAKQETAWNPFQAFKSKSSQMVENIPVIPDKPKNPAKLKLAYGKMMEENGQLVEARQNYNDALVLNPQSEEALIAVARVDLAMGKAVDAEQGYRKALKINANSSEAHYGLGQMYSSQGRWNEASDELTKAMLSNPEEQRYRYALAVALVESGDVHSALPHFIRTVGDAEAHYNVAMILQQKGDLREAERQFSLALVKKPDFEAAERWVAHLQQERGASRDTLLAERELRPTTSPSRNSLRSAAADSAILPTSHETQPGTQQWTGAIHAEQASPARDPFQARSSENR